ncbi:outer membrane protein transport protein [Vibrio fluvialis]|jgi:long-chain fatty acid transport protein|uniref:outer membrane protein transport protein n=1 Tax=Vibrio fluvialis TaxID=676 RepID=UPI0015595436|nr:outer membrane protein transport protein [Vibrio fluvialis]EKO3406624.1 outer membrane protein transport protein [Vibrio fluvialis]EKO3495972.1 outer membrane protein transport protein [Vibrio fluvialis]EKO3518619.1 outer membrane protein transport protein [Vibrio fluvialis]EKO3906564.1 outer membrane protein transport protein [Vibrio fluvialis]EKO3959299.1 outer membrane protein transport protein [Vibrio fluvialis]
MNKTRLFKQSLLAVTISLATQQAMAAGFQLNAQSATGLGRAFAGDAVIADNAAVMSRNAAAMALFDKTSMSLGFETITTMIDVKDVEYKNVLGSSIDVEDTDDVGSTSVAPNLHLIVPVNEQFAWGVTAYSNFGTKTEFSDSYPASEYGGLTDVKSFNFGLAGSYRLNKQLSFGAGLDIIYGQGTMKRVGGDGLALVGYSGTALIDVDKADGWAVGFNVGTVYELDENNRFGLSYRYSPDFEAEDDHGQKITLPLPDIAEFSGFHKIKDTQFAVHYSVQWIGWSDFDKIEFRNLDSSRSAVGAFDNGSYDKIYEWKDGWHFAIGGTYYLNKDWTLRAGYMYDTSAQDSVTSISVPDSDRQWFSTGFTYQIDEQSNFDFGFTYLMGKDVDVSESTTVSGTTVSTLEATTHADAILLGLQYSRTF